MNLSTLIRGCGDQFYGVRYLRRREDPMDTHFGNGTWINPVSCRRCDRHDLDLGEVCREREVARFCSAADFASGRSRTLPCFIHDR